MTAYNSVRRFSHKNRECLASFILQHLVTIVFKMQQEGSVYLNKLSPSRFQLVLQKV